MARTAAWLVAVAAAVLLTATDLWARAGGGGSFGGGGGGGGGGFGGGGGDGGGELFVLLWWLCIEHPVIGIPLTIGVVALMFYGGRSAREGHITRTIRRGRAMQQQELRRDGIAAIRERDPAFSEDAFLDRVGRAFLKIQNAWCRQELAPVRPFISDGIHERFSLQLGMQQAEGIRNEMQDIRILSATTAAVFRGEAFDTIHVRIHASAVDYTVDLETGRRVSGSKSAESFVEFWSFHRRPGAKSLSGEGALEGNCPRCTAPLEIVDVARCQACGAQVNSGEFDWVLAEITQDQEWSVPAADEAVPGLPELKRRDPAFSVQHVEDRVSVAFWRMRAAEFHRDVEYARPILAPESLDEFSGELSRMSQRREFWKDPAVGQVALLDVQEGDSLAPDRIRVKVRWSGTYSAGDPGGTSRDLRRKAIYTHVYVLKRHHDARSTPADTFRSAGCSNCGAPLRVNRAGACEFCDTVITTGRYDWVLEDVTPYSPEMAYRREREAQRPSARERNGEFAFPGDGDAELSLAVLARVMYADGQLDERERQALQRLGSHRGLDAEQVQLVLNTARTSEANLPVPRDAREAMSHLEQLVHATLADGQLTGRERRLLAKYAREVNLSDADVKLVIARQRRQAYRQARRQIRRRGDNRTLST